MWCRYNAFEVLLRRHNQWTPSELALKGTVTHSRADYTGFLRASILQHAEKVLRANRYFASFACTSRVGCKVPACLLRVSYVACAPHPEMARESYVLDADNICNDDVIKWKHFPRNWPFMRAIHRSPVNSPHKGQWRGALVFSLICVWINNWVNNRAAGDLRRYRTHYDVIVMCTARYGRVKCEGVARKMRGDMDI